jgi:hypothetical protein
MAWDPLDDGLYSGDAPMDAFGAAMQSVADAFEKHAGRLPTVAEVVAAFEVALRNAPAGTLIGADTLDAELAPWRAAKRRKDPKRPRKARVGDILAIPYAPDRAVYARVIHVPDRARPETMGLGICVVVLDRDVAPGDDLETVPDAPWLLAPTHPNDRLVREGEWQIVGNVAPRGREQLLPLFRTTVGNPRDGFRQIAMDYFGGEYALTETNLTRIVSPSVGGDYLVAEAVRAKRGLGPWRAALDDLRTREKWGE